MHRSIIVYCLPSTIHRVFLTLEAPMSQFWLILTFNFSFFDYRHRSLAWFFLTFLYFWYILKNHWKILMCKHNSWQMKYLLKKVRMSQNWLIAKSSTLHVVLQFLTMFRMLCYNNVIEAETVILMLMQRISIAWYWLLDLVFLWVMWKAVAMIS